MAVDGRGLTGPQGVVALQGDGSSAPAPDHHGDDGADENKDDPDKGQNYECVHVTQCSPCN